MPESHSVPSSLSVVARHTSSRGASTATSPMALRAPVRASKVAGPRVISFSLRTGRSVGATEGRTGAVAGNWPHATTWAFDAQAVSDASSARTVHCASALSWAGGSGSFRSADSPGASAGTQTVPASTVSPSTWYDHSKASWDRSAKSYELVIRTVPSGPSMRTGPHALFYL